MKRANISVRGQDIHSVVDECFHVMLAQGIDGDELGHGISIKLSVSFYFKVSWRGNFLTVISITVKHLNMSFT